MTGPIGFGLLSALGWGSADFIARFTGRALGHQTALLGMFGVSTLVFTCIFLGLDEPLTLEWSTGGWYLLIIGIGMMVATLLLYRGLAQGPVTVVAPIVGSYPVYSLMIGMFGGVYPSGIQFVAMVVVIVGVAVVAIYGVPSFQNNALGEDRDKSANSSADKQQRSKIVGISLLSSISFAFVYHLSQQVMPIYGEFQVVWLTRWISFIALILLFLFQGASVRVPMRWWPVLTVQGLLDGGAYLSLLYGSSDGGIGSQMVIVIGSSFSVVTVILAKLILHEMMTVRQWLGIGAIVSGVVALLASPLSL